MWLEIASIAAWIILFCVLVFYQDARPQVEIFLDRFFEIEVRETWDNNKLKTAFHLLVFLFLFSTFSIFLNFKRLKRSTDRIRKSFIISLAGSVIGIIIYLSGYLM
jgi:membrane associated rhomboid family serine protease